jgi:hypothetical protein
MLHCRQSHFWDFLLTTRQRTAQNLKDRSSVSLSSGERP